VLRGMLPPFKLVSPGTAGRSAKTGASGFGFDDLRTGAYNDDDLREAVRAELCGYWAWASRRPWMWLDPGIADLALSGMARARYTLRTGQLLTKTEAIEQVHGPAWLIDQLRARRRGEPMSSPRVRTGWIAWRDARDTLGWASRSAPRCGG